jgi:hypothetical protein
MARPRKVVNTGNETTEGQQKAPAAPIPAPKPAASTGPAHLTAFEYVRSLGYMNYTFANEFEYADLNTDQRSYPVAKKVTVLKIKEDDGTVNYVGLAFVGILDDPLFLIIMPQAKAEACAKKINPQADLVGLQFTGVTKHFGNVALVTLSKGVYLDMATKLSQ